MRCARRNWARLAIGILGYYIIEEIHIGGRKYEVQTHLEKSSCTIVGRSYAFAGIYCSCRETTQVMVEAQETVIQDAEKPEDAVKWRFVWIWETVF